MRILEVLRVINRETNIVTSLQEVWSLNPLALILIRVCIDMDCHMFMGWLFICGCCNSFQSIKRDILSPKTEMGFDGRCIINSVTYIVSITALCFINQLSYAMPVQKRIVRTNTHYAINVIGFCCSNKTAEDIVFRTSKDRYIPFFKERLQFIVIWIHRSGYNDLSPGLLQITDYCFQQGLATVEQFQNLTG